jgi:hypothetical protein
MHDFATTRVRGTITLSLEQRERLRREGRIARAVEAGQRRTGGRFSRITPEPTAPKSVARPVASAGVRAGHLSRRRD